MAYEMKIRGTEDEVKVRSPWAAALLPLITFGIYHLVRSARLGHFGTGGAGRDLVG